MESDVMNISRATVVFRTVGEETDVSQVKSFRRMLVGPWCRQPEEYEGYNGFVGWMGLTALRSSAG